MDMQSYSVDPAENSVPDAANSVSPGRLRQLEALRKFAIKPGEVKNPRGRPKKDYDLAEKAAEHAQTAINTLVAVMTNAEASPAARVGAAAEILDRGFGKAPSDLKVKHEISFTDEFEALIRSITTRRTEKVIEHVEENSIEADHA